MAKNEVATTEKNFNLVTLTGELKEAVAEELDGLGTLPFERAKIPSGGGLAFELPGETEDEPVMSTDLTGVLIHHHPVNAYWKEEYAGGNVQPDCSSHDGKQGVERETGEIHDCSKCPHNQFGSGKNGSGKACKNIHRCYILQEGNPVPIILALPPAPHRSTAHRRKNKSVHNRTYRKMSNQRNRKQPSTPRKNTGSVRTKGHGYKGGRAWQQ